jgi:DNA-binding transcriptional regulator GbsR (MarR family)
MDETLQAVHESMITGLGELTDFFGFSPVMGHLYGALLMDSKPLSLDDLEDIVGKSKASVSMNMRALERWGMVREVWVKGDRRKFYEAESDLWKVVTAILESRERREVGVALKVLSENANRLEEAQSTLSEEERQRAEFYLDRVQDMRRFFEFASFGLDMLLQQSGLPQISELVETYEREGVPTEKP